ncbi:ScyD/ScyE family protein [Egicoccus sp. AB-alg2]|uniref:ScyD/ScyE family protein n=1 Tax=Egicoccus sp. AB-alg2 TaxID=3242693 RepID=UPI00359CCAAB
MRGRLRAAVLAAALAVPAAVASPARARDAERVTVLVDDLQNPRGVAVDADDNVYVAESGSGGGDVCLDVPGEDGVSAEVCFGTTSAITRVTAGGTVEADFIDDLPSLAMGDEGAVGATAVAVAADGMIYVAFGWGQSASTRDAVADVFPPAALFGTVQRLERDGSLTEVADIARWEEDNNPDQAPPADPDSNPSDLFVDDGTLYVVDAGGNTLLGVDLDSGDIELLALFPTRDVPPPPFLPGNDPIPMQSVPTSITQDVEGRLVVGELTGFPFPVGGANLYDVDPAVGEPVVRTTGLTSVTGVAVRGADVFAVQLAVRGLMEAQQDPRGAVARVWPNGARADLFAQEFVLPYGVAADSRGFLYVSAGAILPTGSLLRVDPSLAGDPAIRAACPMDGLEVSGFTDLRGSVHGEAILCMAWYGVFLGRTDGSFRPGDSITRGQFASAVVRLIEATGTDLPAPRTRFPDLAGNVHGRAVRQLATAGIVQGFSDGTFRPQANITRAQAVTMMVGAYDFVGDDLPAAPASPFTDIAGSPHERNIDRAHRAGWVAGVGGSRFAPSRSITRGQTASVLARTASTLVTDGALTTPAG